MTTSITTITTRSSTPERVERSELATTTTACCCGASLTGVLRGERDVREHKHRLLRLHRPPAGQRAGQEPHARREGGAHGAAQVVGGVEATGPAARLVDCELDGVLLKGSREGPRPEQAAVVGHAHVVPAGRRRRRTVGQSVSSQSG
eukprot:1004114-Prorocentrum_minimum.AAC.3